jgi:hypothetical protein
VKVGDYVYEYESGVYGIIIEVLLSIEPDQHAGPAWHILYEDGELDYAFTAELKTVSILS